MYLCLLSLRSLFISANLSSSSIDLIGGDPLGQFAIENIQNEWKVFVKKPLDREKRDNYLLTITATDGTFSSKAIVEVKVLDANDNSPVCEKVGGSFFMYYEFGFLSEPFIRTLLWRWL